jgi:hypothetical protein
VLTALAAPSAQAVSIILGYGSNPSGIGGEFAVTPIKAGDAAAIAASQAFVNAIAANYDPLARFNGGFETFCIEYNEHFSPGAAYNVQISPGAIKGGKTDTDLISVGTAYIYSLFATGQLHNAVAAYNYNNTASAGQLQNAFWFLEGEGIANPGIFNALLAAEFGNDPTAWKSDGVANASGNYVTAASYGVSALNMGSAPTFPNQDQLVFQRVPDGGTTVVLLGLAMGGLALLKRRFA